MKNTQTKDSRKELVKKTRQEFKKNPEQFITNIGKDIITYWKERPLHAIGIFLFWAILYYSLFGGIQAINNDLIYCDASIDEYDGKLMIVYNSFVKEYNKEVIEMQNEYVPSIEEQEYRVKRLNEKYTMYCDYNIQKWNNETIQQRIESITKGFITITTKGVINWELNKNTQ